MSHLRERKEKNCLNCNAFVQGRYCHICGQENREAKESAWHLINHFFKDITHFDGKFFASLKSVVFKPGFLAKEYMNGRRASHLNPVRMYIFTSAFFFLIFFSMYKVTENSLKIPDFEGTVGHYEKIKAMNDTLYKKYADSIVAKKPKMAFMYNKKEYLPYLDSIMNQSRVRFVPGKYKSREQYDSALAHGKQHNWLERKLTYKQFEINQKYKGNPKGAIGALMDKLLHSLPQLLFISLPLFALLLKLLYLRQKKYYYVNHAVFTLHLFIFTFIALFFVFACNKLEDVAGWEWAGGISGLIVLLIFFYNYKAMRNFYMQGRIKTILKFCLLHFVNFFIVMLLFLAFIFLSLFNI